MATDRIALARPYNTTAITDAMIFGDTGGTHAHYSTQAGTYGSILTLLKEAETALKTQFASGSITINANYKIVINLGGPSGPLTFGDATFRNALGFTGNQTSAYIHTATYRPEHLWVSTYSPSSQTDFYWDQRELWTGVEALDGNLAGGYVRDIFSGNLSMKKTVDVVFETASNTFYGLSGENNWSPYRTIEWFALKSRAQTTAASADAPATGFYFFWDADDAQPVASMTTNDGVFTGAADNSTHQFCQFSPEGMSRPIPALPKGKTHYNFQLSFHTAESPTWIED